MRKRVNGTMVEINNIDLFRLAYEGKALNRQADNKISDWADIDTSLMFSYVNAYNEVYGKLVFPLNSIESDIKYTLIAVLLKDKFKDISLYIKDGLHIKLKDDKYLHLVALTWGIECVEKAAEVSLRLDKYRDEIGYAEYVWAYEQLSKGSNTDEFYHKFMPDFAAACRNQRLVIDWELTRILSFGDIPSALNLKRNKITDYKHGVEFQFDVYNAGEKETGEECLAFSVDKSGKPVMETQKQKITVYDYDVYGKNLMTSNNRLEKVSTDKYPGFNSLFDLILSKGIDDGMTDNLYYIGIIEDDTLLVELNNDVYITSLSEYKEATHVMSGVSLLTMTLGKVYVSKKVKMDSGVYEHTVYSYELSTGKARLCGIEYLQS